MLLERPYVWKDHLKGWGQSSFLAHWLKQQKKNKEKSLENLLEEAVSSLRVWERDGIIKQKKGEVSLTTALVQEVRKQGEKHVRALQEQTKAIQDLNKTLTDYFYNRGRQCGLTPLPGRPQTPVVSRFHDEHQITSTADK